MPRRGGRTSDGFGLPLPRGAGAKMLRGMLACPQVSECGGSGRPAECRQHILRNRPNLHRGAIFHSPNVRRSRSCAPRGTGSGPLRVVLVARHPRSVVNFGAIRRAAMALPSTERPRRNGARINRPAAQSRRSWCSIRFCGIMCKTGLPLQTGRLSPVQTSCGRGVGPCIGKAGAGQRHGARNRFLAVFGSTFPRMRRCGLATRQSTKRFTCRAAERYVAN